MWRVAQVDLHDGLESLVADYRAEALAAFTAQGTLHTVVFAVSWVVWALFLWLLLKPYVQVRGPGGGTTSWQLRMQAAASQRSGLPWVAVGGPAGACAPTS